MGWHYGFRPYVPVAQRRREAQRELEKMRKKGLKVLPIDIDGRVIAKTFWGKAWCENLESYSDFENRLPRGRTYVRNGSVVHLEIQSGRISALVSGSELYSVEITISSLPDPDWKCVKSRCAGQIGSLIELLQGRLSRSVMDVVTERGEGLFPKPAEIDMTCSCPDWAGMCKHVAAVMYGVGARLDDQPELLFLLRKVDHLELIAGAVEGAPIARAGKSRGKKTIAAGDLADVFGIEMAEPETPTEASPKIAKTPAKPRAPASKTAPKEKQNQAVIDSRKSAGVAAANRKRPKTATAHANAAPPARTKPPARTRVKQTTS
ncbi:MAG: SWIM zinc finger family protein [Isosphaerales bacterium]